MKAVILSTLAASAIAGQATLTSVTPNNVVAGATPGNVVYVFAPATQLVFTSTDADNFAFTHSAARYAADSAVTCTVAITSGTGTAGTVACTASASGTVNTCLLSTASDFVAADVVTVTCTSNIAANGAAGAVTTAMVTTTDTTAATDATTTITAAKTCADADGAGSGTTAVTCSATNAFVSIYHTSLLSLKF
jgi:hypothetical protein